MSRHTLKILKAVWRRCRFTRVCQMAAWIRDKFFWYYASLPQCSCTFAFRSLAQCYCTYLLGISTISWTVLSLWVTWNCCQVTPGRMLKLCLSAVSVQKEAPSHHPQSQHGFPVSTAALEVLPAPQATDNEAPTLLGCSYTDRGIHVCCVQACSHPITLKCFEYSNTTGVIIVSVQNFRDVSWTFSNPAPPAQCFWSNSAKLCMWPWKWLYCPVTQQCQNTHPFCRQVRASSALTHPRANKHNEISHYELPQHHQILHLICILQHLSS